MSINFSALLRGYLEISATHGSVTNTYVISLIPILVILLILALISVAVFVACARLRK